MKQLYCILTLLIIIGGVSALDCRKPLKNINNTCCDDNNNNTVCDYNDIQKQEPLDPSLIKSSTTSTSVPKPRTAEELIALEKDPSSSITLPYIEATTTTTSSPPATVVTTTPTTVLETPATNAPMTISPTTTQSSPKPTITPSTQPSPRPTISNTRPMPTTTVQSSVYDILPSGINSTAALILLAVAVIAIVLYKMGSDED